jgi:hypothetical protein
VTLAAAMSVLSRPAFTTSTTLQPPASSAHLSISIF